MANQQKIGAQIEAALEAHLGEEQEFAALVGMVKAEVKTILTRTPDITPGNFQTTLWAEVFSQSPLLQNLNRLNINRFSAVRATFFEAAKKALEDTRAAVERTVLASPHPASINLGVPSEVTPQPGNDSYSVVAYVEGFLPHHRIQYSVDGGTTWQTCPVKNNTKIELEAVPVPSVVCFKSISPSGLEREWRNAQVRVNIPAPNVYFNPRRNGYAVIVEEICRNADRIRVRRNRGIPQEINLRENHSGKYELQAGSNEVLEIKALADVGGTTFESAPVTIAMPMAEAEIAA